MAEDRPQIRSRPRRLLAYLSTNRHRMAVDIVVLLAWIILTWTAFSMLGLPRWLLYIILFGGVFFYTRITPTWERPYRSPDIDT